MRVLNLQVALGLLLALFVVVVAPLHGLVPMWVEGMPVYLDQLAGAIGRPCSAPSGALRVGTIYVPLAIDAYQGPLMTYLDIPAAYFSYSGASNDLYLYRYKGIILLALSAFLFFAVLRRFFDPTASFLAALVFVTLPVNVVCSIVDLQYHIALYFGILCAAWGFVLYRETKKPGWCYATAALAGLALWTRAEALIWPGVALVAFAVLFRRKELFAEWRRTRHRGRLLLLSVPAFLVGSGPIVAFNILYPRSGLVAFLLTGAGTTGSGIDVSRYLKIRLTEFIDFILLNNWNMYVVRSGYWLLLVAFSVCAAGVAGLWIKLPA